MAKNYKVTGTVKYAGKTNEEKNVISLLIDDERAKVLIEQLELDILTYESTPIKENEKGEQLFRATSKFAVKIYGKGEETPNLSLTDIGEFSKVELFVGIATTKYKNKTYQVAYLKSVNILKLCEPTRFNPFEKNSDVEEV